MWGEERIIEGQETGEIISHLVFTAIPNPEPETAINSIQPRSTHVTTSNCTWHPASQSCQHDPALVVPPSHLREEEHFDEFKSGQNCPVRIGDVLASNRYQVVGKLGFGSTMTTVWLARNLMFVLKDGTNSLHRY